MAFKFDNGDKVKDRMTGFQGLVIARVDFITGCNRYTVQPEKLDAGKVADSVTFDEPLLELVTANKFAVATPKAEKGEKPGGGANPPRRPNPARK